MKHTEKNIMLPIDKYNYLINQCQNPNEANTSENDTPHGLTKHQSSLPHPDPVIPDTETHTQTPPEPHSPIENKNWLTKPTHKNKSILAPKKKSQNQKAKTNTPLQKGGKQISHPTIKKKPRKPSSKTTLGQLLNSLQHTLLKQTGSKPNPVIYQIIDHMRQHKGSFVPSENAIKYRGKKLKLPHLAKIIMYISQGKNSEKFIKEQSLFKVFLQESNFNMPPHLDITKKLKHYWLTN